MKSAIDLSKFHKWKLLILCFLFSCGGDDDRPIENIPVEFQGNLAWVASFGGSGIDQATAVTSTSDGAFMVVGSTYSNDGHFNGIKNSGYQKDRLQVQWGQTT